MDSKIKTARLKKNLTQQQVADFCKISLRTYQRIETEERKPSYDIISKLEKLFNISYHQLFTVVNDDTKF